MGPRVCDIRGFQEMGRDVTAGLGRGPWRAEEPGGPAGEKKEVQSSINAWIGIESCSTSAFYNFNVILVKFFNFLSN